VSRFAESLDDGWGQYFEIERELRRSQSAYQEIRIFETPLFGRVLVLDGVVQTTTLDEYIYHEMLAHVPLMAHPAPERVLIVGGGDGGTLRETLKHPVREAVLVEIDAAVITACRESMPELAGDAFEDSRCRIEIADAARFVRGSRDGFDAILIDSSDPVGPNAPLFDEAFYAACAERLRPGGLLAAQHGVAFLHREAFRAGHARVAGRFARAAAYQLHVPTYSGGATLITLAGQADEPLVPPEATLATRLNERGIAPRHYTPALHGAAFALPRDIAALTEAAGAAAPARS